MYPDEEIFDEKMGEVRKLTLRELYIKEAIGALAGKLTSNDGGTVYAHRVVGFVDEIIKEMGK